MSRGKLRPGELLLVEKAFRHPTGKKCAKRFTLKSGNEKDTPPPPQKKTIVVLLVSCWYPPKTKGTPAKASNKNSDASLNSFRKNILVSPSQNTLTFVSTPPPRPHETHGCQDACFYQDGYQDLSPHETPKSNCPT